MNFSVELQDPFSYSRWILILLGLFVFGYIAYRLFLIFKKKYDEYRIKHPKKPKMKKIKDLQGLKNKYISELQQIEGKLDMGQISGKAAYQEMSYCIRSFIFEVTGLNVQNCTLTDVKNMGIPALEILMTEYYAPEFSMDIPGNAKASIEKTKRVIESWN